MGIPMPSQLLHILEHPLQISFAAALLTTLAFLCLPKGTHPICHDFRVGDVRHSQADISKVRVLLGYQTTHRMAEGLAITMEWYAHHR